MQTTTPLPTEEFRIEGFAEHPAAENTKKLGELAQSAMDKLAQAARLIDEARGELLDASMTANRGLFFKAASPLTREHNRLVESPEKLRRVRTRVAKLTQHIRALKYEK